MPNCRVGAQASSLPPATTVTTTPATSSAPTTLATTAPTTSAMALAKVSPVHSTTTAATTSSSSRTNTGGIPVHGLVKSMIPHLCNKLFLQVSLDSVGQMESGQPRSERDPQLGESGGRFIWSLPTELQVTWYQCTGPSANLESESEVRRRLFSTEGQKPRAQQHHCSIQPGPPVSPT